MSEFSSENEKDLFLKFCRNSIIEYGIIFICSIAYAIIYEFLGKGVHSLYNRLLWIVPLVFGAIVFLFVAFMAYKSGKSFTGYRFLSIIMIVYKVTIVAVCLRLITKGIGEVYGAPMTKSVIFDYLSLAGIFAIFILTIVFMVNMKKQKHLDA